VAKPRKEVFQMKNIKKWNKMFLMGMAAIALSFGLVLASCGTTGTAAASNTTGPAAASRSNKEPTLDAAIAPGATVADMQRFVDWYFPIANEFGDDPPGPVTPTAGALDFAKRSIAADENGGRIAQYKSAAGTEEDFRWILGGAASDVYYCIMRAEYQE
jgi:hypothetical protein